MPNYHENSFEHGNSPLIGVLITNLGTPEAPTAKALKPYLREFLSDPRVVEFPRALWWLVLNGIILNIRPGRSAKAYQSVWTEKGSPLATHTSEQAEKLGRVLTKKYGNKVLVRYAMRYGKPGISSEITSLMDAGVTKLFVLPLYPQYSATTTASTFDALAKDFTHRRWLPELRFANGYHDDPVYIKAICTSIEDHWRTHGKPEKTLFSYHGVPVRYLHKGDPYHCFCLQTTRLIAAHLELTDDEYLCTFQSRFGREPWLQPYTDECLKQLGADGIKRVDVVCPGFSSDCLETIEEIDNENRAYFIDSGGKDFHYIPALNAQEVHIQALADICERNIRDWVDISAKHGVNDAQAAKNRYIKHPFNQ